MKTIILILGMGIAIGGCGSNDDSNDSNSKLQGTWTLSSQMVNGESVNLAKCDSLHSISFLDTVFTSNSYHGLNCEEKQSLSGSFTSTKSSFTTILNSQTSTATILNLTNVKLKFRSIPNETDTVESIYKK